MPGGVPIAPTCIRRAPRLWAAPMHPPPKPAAVNHRHPVSIRLVAAPGMIRACNKMPAEAGVSAEQVAYGEF